MKKITQIMLIGVVVLSWCASPKVSFAESQIPPGISQQDTVSCKGQHKGWGKGGHKGWDKEEFLKLKQEDPQKFEELMQQRQEKLKERLAYLKDSDPERYHRVMRRLRGQRFARLEGLKESDPQKFKELMSQRRKSMQGCLEALKKEDPQKYEQIMQHKKKLEELRGLGEKDTQAFQEYLKEHPRHQNRFEGPWEWQQEESGSGKDFQQGKNDAGCSQRQNRKVEL